MYPQAAICVECGCPYPESAVEVIAVEFPYIARVILEPLEVDLPYTFYGMLVVFVELAEVDTEMAVVPVRICGVVHFSAIAFGAATRSVASQSDSSVLYMDCLCAFLVSDVCVKVIDIVLEFIIPLQQLVPLILGYADCDFRYDGLIPYVADSHVVETSSRERHHRSWFRVHVSVLWQKSVTCLKGQDAE